jgi:tetratricopeptide (TPR) repeat protein
METRTSPCWPLLIACAAVLVHLNSLGNGFTLDDVTLVERNPSIASIAGIPRLFTEPYLASTGERYGLYRPVTVATLAINRAITGPSPWGFHLGNVLLHAAVAALAWMALRRAGFHYGTAFLGGMIFAVHPLHTEVVANVAGRAELSAALFVLAAWLLHRRASDEPARLGFRVGAGLCYLAAILSKEGAVAAPILFWADDALRPTEGPRPSARVRYGAYAAAFAVLLALRALVLGPHQGAVDAIPLDNPAAAAGTFPRVATALWVQLKYALLCLWPHPLSSDYSADVIPVARSLGDPRALAGAAFVVLCAGGVAWGWKRSRPVALAGLLWVLFFLPASNLLFATGTIMAERLAYLPSLGFCLAIGHLGGAAAALGDYRRARLRAGAVVAASAIAVTALGTLTWLRNPAWKDNLTLATTDVATYPTSAKLQAGAGIFLAAAGRDAEAERHLTRAIEIYPAYAQMHYNLAVLLNKRGATEEAIEHLRRAVELAPANPRPRKLLEQLTRK